LQAYQKRTHIQTNSDIDLDFHHLELAACCRKAILYW